MIWYVLGFLLAAAVLTGMVAYRIRRRNYK